MQVKRLTLRECLDVPDSGVRKFRNMLWLPLLMIGVSVVGQLVVPHERAALIGYLAGGVGLFMLMLLFPGIRRMDEIRAAKAEQHAQWNRNAAAAADRLEGSGEMPFEYYRNETLARRVEALALRSDGEDGMVLMEVVQRLRGGERTRWLESKRAPK